MTITYTPVYSPSMQGDVKAQYKNVIMDLYIADKGVCIDEMNCTNPNKGECQEMITLLREDFQGKELFASPAKSDASRHIFDKMGVKYVKGKGSNLE